MPTLSTGSVLVLQRDKTDAGEVPTLQGGDTFYGSLPDGDPFGGTVIERHGNRAIVEVDQRRYHLHKAQEHEASFDVTVGQPHEFWVID
jgi:ribosomal protein L35AE/L33A